LIKRGEIYLDTKFKYPAGNVEDKYILILNKSYQTGDPIIVATATTSFNKTKSKPGCNHRISAYFVKSKEDFFPEDTLIQLYIINHPIAEKDFINKREKEEINYKASLNAQTISKIMKCVNEIKDDLTSGFHKYLF